MDLRTGKLSDDDWRELDRRLRAEAIEILHALDALGPRIPSTRRRGRATQTTLRPLPSRGDDDDHVRHLRGLSVALIFLVLMHSGKDAGLSGAFGVGTGPGSLGGGSLVERNLNRWTVGIAIVWILVIILLVKNPGNASRISPRWRRPRSLACQGTPRSLRPCQRRRSPLRRGGRRHRGRVTGFR